MTLLIDDIQKAINRHSAENVSNTPDYVLATFLVRALAAFDNATNLRALHMEPPKHPEPSVVTDAMVSRFLSWKLPQDFAPDSFVRFNQIMAREVNSWPTGTNLLHAGQARAMLEHVLGAPPDQAVIHLTPHEVQSGSTRVDWAEGLIRQLPETHDGRNSWLLNYGSDADERQAAWAERNPNSPLAHAINLGQVTGTAPDARPKPSAAAADAVETGQSKQPCDQFDEALPTKVTIQMVGKAIVAGRYDIIPGTQITVCTLTLRNGAKVVGVNYGSIDPDKQDWEQGKNAAYEAAREKVWELEGYLVRQRMHEAKQGGAA